MPRQSGATSVLAMPRLPHTREPPTPASSSGPSMDSVGYAGAWLTPPHPSCSTAIPRGHTPGFANLGNTCFLNAALQCLLHTPLTTLLLSSKHHDNFSPHTKRFCVFCSLKALARQLHATPTPRVVAPSAFANNARLVCAAFRHGRQEDAHEFVRALLDGMTRAQVFGCAFGRAGGAAVAWQREMNADVHRLFGGVLQSCVQCTHCDFKSITTEPFLDLSLEISRVSSVERALDRFCAVETLQGDNRYKCEGCRSLVDAHKRFSVRRAPNVLTLHLKRFDRTRKDARFISFPETLDLAPYMYGRPREATAMYRLSALLIHQGTSRQFGHYYAYVRTASGSWCLKDDSTSRSAELSTVMKQKAYLLFYTRMEAPVRTKAKKSQQNPVSVARKETTGIGTPSTRVTKAERRYAIDATSRSSISASQRNDSMKNTTARHPPSPSSNHSPKRNESATPLAALNNDDRQIELSEESSDEEEMILRKRSKSHMTNKTQSSENSDDRSSRKSDGPKHMRAAVTENAKRILRSPVKALASLTGSRRLSDDKTGKAEESGMRRLLGPGRRRSESTTKSPPREATTPGENKTDRAVKSSSLVEPVAKAFTSRKVSVLSYKRHEDRAKKSKSGSENEDGKPSSESSDTPTTVRAAVQKRFDRRAATAVEGFAGKKKSPAEGKEQRRFFSTLRRESKLVAKQEARVSQGSDEETIPSNQTSSAEDDEKGTVDRSPSQGKQSQGSPQSPHRRASSQEVLIAGGSKVQTVMRRVFGLTPLGNRADKKRGAASSAGTGQNRQPPEGRKGSPSSDTAKETKGSPSRSDGRSKLQFRTNGAVGTSEGARTSSPRPRLGNSSLFSAEGVDTWDNASAVLEEKPEESVRSFARSKIVKRRRVNDSLDADYDRGKQKKARQKFSPASNGKGRNVFEAFVERKR